MALDMRQVRVTFSRHRSRVGLCKVPRWPGCGDRGARPGVTLHNPASSRISAASSWQHRGVGRRACQMQLACQFRLRETNHRATSRRSEGRRHLAQTAPPSAGRWGRSRRKFSVLQHHGRKQGAPWTNTQWPRAPQGCGDSMLFAKLRSPVELISIPQFGSPSDESWLSGNK